MAREIEALRGHNVLLQRDLAVVQRDEEIERLARTELGFVKPGDRPVVLIWPDGQLPPDERARSRNERVEPVWRGWLRVFFDAE